MSSKKVIGELILHPDDFEIASMVIARLLAIMNPHLDEVSASEVLEEYLQDNSLDLENVFELGALIRAESIFDPRYHCWN